MKQLLSILMLLVVLVSCKEEKKSSIKVVEQHNYNRVYLDSGTYSEADVGELMKLFNDSKGLRYAELDSAYGRLLDSTLHIGELKDMDVKWYGDKGINAPNNSGTVIGVQNNNH